MASAMNLALRCSVIFVVGIGLFACKSQPIPSPPPISRNSSLSVFVEPAAGDTPIIDGLNAAKKSVRMTMYLLTEKEIIDALKSARGRGVDVRVMLEAQPIGSGLSNRQAMTELQAANITVKASNPSFRLTHQKSIVVDDRVAYILTFNQTHSAFTLNRDYGIIDSNPDDVAEIISVFEADWKRTTPTLSNSNLVWSPVNSRARILALIDSAKQSLELEQEDLQDDDVVTHLVDAVKRGISVRLVMPPHDSVNDADKPGQERLTLAGANLRLLKTPYIHAKIIIADKTRALVSSQDISTSSLDLNRELGILVTDPTILQTLAATFESDWNIGK